MTRINRAEYLDKLIAVKDKQIIKIITGVRRCGKSTLMELFQDKLREDGVSDDRIISINLEDFDNRALRNEEALHKYIKQRLVKGKMTYIFIDEVQRREKFPDVIDSLLLKPDVDIYLTSSNASLLSSETATLLSGRYIEIAMLPLSFKEYMLSTGNENDLSRKYREYVESSSFPYVINLKGQQCEIREYLEGLYSTIVVKDISLRKKPTYIMMIERVIQFIFDNIGNHLSTKKIADTMTSEGRKIDVKTVDKYIDSLMESFILYCAPRYNIKGKQYLKPLGKYYAVDICMRYMLLGTRGSDVGHILENIVYLELLRRGYEVYVGKLDELEVDFVAVDRTRTICFQVAATVRDEYTLKRKLLPLK